MLVSMSFRSLPRVAAGFLLVTLLVCGGVVSATAQNSSSSSSSISNENLPKNQQQVVARPSAVDPAGSAVTLETNEALFDIAVALNVCGYDADLENSDPVRLVIRDELNQALAKSVLARETRDTLCTYIRGHRLNSDALNLAQYISLAVYVTPPPALTPSVDETELPADSTQVVSVLPLIRAFSDAVQLHLVWVRHRLEYEALVTLAHDPLSKAILNTNIYLKQPASSYDGRRFLVLLEPMIAPAQTNARIYGTDYIVVVSPAKNKSGAGPDSFPMDQIRHTYLHYEIEPLVYARASSTDRMQPLLKTVHDAPLDFTYKSDIIALLTESLIKAIEARTMDVGFPKPDRPKVVKQRADLEHYDAEMAVYDRQAEVVRHKTVEKDVRQGYVLTTYFYDKLIAFEKDAGSLSENIGEMVYGMDVDHEVRAARQVVFLEEGDTEFARRAPRQLRGLDLAEVDLIKNKPDDAASLATQALKDGTADPGRAHFILARVESMHGEMAQAIADFKQTIADSKDPRTLAWAHIYMGRVYDIQDDRDQAMEEYRAALANRDSQPDTRAAAEKGLKEPFVLPKSAQQNNDDDDKTYDPADKYKDLKKPPSQ